MQLKISYFLKMSLLTILSSINLLALKCRNEATELEKGQFEREKDTPIYIDFNNLSGALALSSGLLAVFSSFLFPFCFSQRAVRSLTIA